LHKKKPKTLRSKSIEKSTMELMQRDQVLQGVGFKTEQILGEKNCIKKRKHVSISGVEKKMIESEKEKVNEDETRLEQTPYKKPVDPFIDDPKVKKTLSNWRQVKSQVRPDEREVARFKLEGIQNTGRFSDNMDAMQDFHKLIGCSKCDSQGNKCSLYFQM